MDPGCKVNYNRSELYLCPFFLFILTHFVQYPIQNGRPNYSITLPRVYVPFGKISASSLEADVSRLGLDFLEYCSLRFQTLDIDRDQIIILEINPAKS